MALSNSVLITDSVAGIQVNQRTATTDTVSNEWVAAQGAGGRIYIIALDWCDTSATTITIQSAANTIAVYELAANAGMIGSLEVPLFTALNEALNITTSSVGVMKITWTTDQRIAYRLRVI